MNDKNYFIVSSTLSAILQIIKHQATLDLKKLEEYFLTRHFLFDKKTCYKNINLFSPGVNYKFILQNSMLYSSVYDDPIDWISEKNEIKFKS